MATTAETFATLIGRRVGNDRRDLDPANYVDPAVRIYERYRPREVAADYSASGANEYACTTVSSLWVPGFSRVVWVEYKIDQTPPVYLDDGDYFVRRVANTGTNKETLAEKLYFHTVVPASGVSFRLCFTTRHTVNATYSSVAEQDEAAVADFGASVFLEDLAVRYASLRSQEGLAVEEVVGYEEKAESARASARAARRRARIQLGLSADERDDEATPVGTSVAVRDFDLPLHRGYGGLTHPRRYR